jgi:16S rRNA (guanine966-N2)-methyltransferase
MIRILAGEKKGRLLKTPHTKAVRPTAANARQVLFDILGDVSGTHWLDLYAGSGAVGFEALSRGAADCVLVESARACVKAIRENIELLAYHDRAHLLDGPVQKALRWLANASSATDQGAGRSSPATERPAHSRAAFDFIFLDPPYHAKEAAQTLLALGDERSRLLFAAPDALVIAQITTHLEVRPRYGALELTRERKMGDTNLCFFRKMKEAN